MVRKRAKNRTLYVSALTLGVLLVAGAIVITLLIAKNQHLTTEIQTITQERNDKQTEIEKLQKDHKLSMKAADGYVQAIDNALSLCSGLSIMAEMEDVCIDGVSAQINQDTWEAMQKIQEEVRRARKNDQ